MAGLILNSNYTFAAGQTFTFGDADVTNGDTVIFIAPPPPPAVDTVYVDGTIQVTAHNVANVTAIASLTNNLVPLNQPISVWIRGTGSLTLQSDSTQFPGLTGFSGYAFHNDGVLTVSVPIATSGYYGYGATGASIYERLNSSLVNTGQITVSGGSASVGVSISGATAINSGGTISVDSEYGMGVHVSASTTTASTVINTGTIQVSNSSGQHHYGSTHGVLVSGSGNEAATTIINAGTITGQDSINAWNAGTNSAAAASPKVIVQNTGTLQGDIELGGGPDPSLASLGGSEIHNQGHIVGAVTLEVRGDDLYDGRGGTLSGALAFGGGYALVYLGDEGETISGQSAASSGYVGTLVAIGGAAADLITGGAGADRLSGGGGADTLTGGAGADIFVARPGTSSDSITDFSHAQGDRVDLSAFAPHGFADALSHAAQVGSDTVFTFGADTVTLRGVAKSAIVAHDLILSSAGHDLTGSGYSDVLFREAGAGQWGYAAFDPAGHWTWDPMGGSTASYGLVGQGDFNGDGIGDILFREGATGNWGIAQMNSAGGYVWRYMGPSTASYGEVMVGDFNGDGVSDIVFREASTGAWGVATMHGGSYTWTPMGGSTASYSLVGAGDFNGDGVSDLLFRETATGNWGIAFMNTHGGYGWLPEGGSTASYSVVGTGDFNGDGTSDILFRENSTGNWGYAAMNHSGGWTWDYMGGSTQSYTVASVGDYNADGFADIAFRENATGNWGIAQMHGTTYTWLPQGGSTQDYLAF